MKNLKKYTYCLETISALALSPREQAGFYLEAGDFTESDIKDHLVVDAAELIGSKNVKIIYPFYQYGTYPKYEPDRAQYYIPGSSIKGAVQSKDTPVGPGQLLVDDMMVVGERLHLRNLYKIQDIPPTNTVGNSVRQVTLDTFFPNVVIEMLDAGTVCDGEMFCEGNLRDHLLKGQDRTQERLKQFQLKIERLIDGECNKRDDPEKKNQYCRAVLSQLQKNVGELLDRLKGQDGRHEADSYLLILGGYKGLLLSGKFNCDPEKSAVYVDLETNLPHGLVWITLGQGA